jgi:hypothetical protein
MDNVLEELIVDKIRTERDKYFMDSTVENKARLDSLYDLWGDYLEVKSKSLKIKIN